MSTQADRSDEAKAIYQDLLERIAISYRDDDFEDYVSMVAVPLEVVSDGSTARIETTVHLREFFDDVRAFQGRNGITDYHRVCHLARFVAENEIDGTHETRLLSGAHTIEGPYPVRSLLRFQEGKWMIYCSENTLDPNLGLGRMLKSIATNVTSQNE